CFYVDASALGKRYVLEKGTPLVNHLFQHAPRNRLICLTLGTLEVVSILVRKVNTGLLLPAEFRTALTSLQNEVVLDLAVAKVTATDLLVSAAVPLVQKHFVNATDAVILRSALDLATQFRAAGGDLVLVTSDQRLLKAAQAEGLLTFDPETQSQTDLDTLLGP